MKTGLTQCECCDGGDPTDYCPYACAGLTVPDSDTISFFGPPEGTACPHYAERLMLSPFRQWPALSVHCVYDVRGVRVSRNCPDFSPGFAQEVMLDPLFDGEFTAPAGLVCNGLGTGQVNFPNAACPTELVRFVKTNAVWYYIIKTTGTPGCVWTQCLGDDDFGYQRDAGAGATASAVTVSLSVRYVLVTCYGRYFGSEYRCPRAEVYREVSLRTTFTLPSQSDTIPAYTGTSEGRTGFAPFYCGADYFTPCEDSPASGPPANVTPAATLTCPAYGGGSAVFRRYDRIDSPLAVNAAPDPLCQWRPPASLWLSGSISGTFSTIPASLTGLTDEELLIFYDFPTSLALGGAPGESYSVAWSPA